MNSSFEKNQESNYLVWSLITHYWTFSKASHEKPEAAIKSSSNAIDLFVLLVELLCFYDVLLSWGMQVCAARECELPFPTLGLPSGWAVVASQSIP